MAAARLRPDHNHLAAERSDPREALPSDDNAAATDGDGDNPEARAAWFREGRTTAHGEGTAASKLHHEIARKIEMRSARLLGPRSLSQNAAQPASSLAALNPQSASASFSSTSALAVQWTPLGPAPITSYAGQDYGSVTGRVTAIAVDASDPSGNTVFIGAGGGGVWKSTNAAGTPVTWTPLTDDQPTLSIGALAVQPTNTNCNTASAGTCVVLAGTGETDNSGDSYYGLGILRSNDGGQSWTLIDKSADGKLFHGLGFAAIAFNTDSPNTVVAATAAASEAIDVGAEFTGVTRGAYYSTDAGQTWMYAQFLDGSQPLAPGSVTSVVYDSVKKLFFAAYRFHGIYSSSNGQTWTRLANQPGGALLSTTTCPVTAVGTNCPLYRAELAVQPQTGELFTWFVDANAKDEGIFKSTDGGASWTVIHDPAANDGITNCKDTGFSSGVNGCGTDQATFNMELIAAPTTAGTDVYAGAVNVFRCSITSSNPACQSAGSWINLTHVYGCTTTGGAFQPNTHPDQHAIAAVPGQPIIYFGNDGGVYRSRNGASLTGQCATPFDDLNANLGSLAQLISFSQDPTTANTLQVGSQDNGTAATTDTVTWNTVGGGDGGYNEIDPNNSGNWLNSGNYIDIAYCAGGAAICNSPVKFMQIVNSADAGGDAAPFFMRYILDPTKSGQMLVGTCRLWRGSATTSWGTSPGTAISPNFFRQSTQACASGDDMIRSIAAGGPAGSNGANVIYVGTKNGIVWVTRSPSASTSSWSGGPLPNASTTCGGNSHCPISDIVIDPRDTTGATAYAAVMGFGTPHLYKTTNFGASWSDITSNLPDVPANAILLDPTNSNTIYVGTDIGVFASTDAGQTWSEFGVGLPNAPVTFLRAFPPSGGAQLLRASTYGRGLWQAPLAGTVPDFQIILASNSAQSYPATSALIQGTITPSGGYAQTVTVTCNTASAPSLQCGSTTVSGGAPQNFTVSVSDATIGDYSFNLVARGADAVTHVAAFTLHVGDFGVSLTTATLNAPHSSPQSVGVTVNTLGSYSGVITLGCSGLPAGISCSSATSALSVPVASAATMTITAGSSAAAGTYAGAVTATAADGHAQSAPLSVTVTANPLVVLTSSGSANLGSVKVGQSLTANLSAVSQDGFSGTATLTCAPALATQGACTVTPGSVTVSPGSVPQPVSIAISTAAATPQNATVTTTATSSAGASKVTLNYTITDFSLGMNGGAALTGSTAQLPVTISPLAGYTGTVNVGCDVSAIPGATCTLSPAGPYTVSSAAVNVTANVVLNSASSGNYAVTLKATDAAFATLAHSATANLAVQDFSVVPQVQNLTIKAGSAASAVISIAAQNSFSGGVSFSCSGLPSGSACVFTPNVLASVAGGATTVMTISTAKPGAAQPAAATARNGAQIHSGDGAAIVAGNHQPDGSSQRRETQPRNDFRWWGSLPLFGIFSVAGAKRKRRKGSAGLGASADQRTAIVISSVKRWVLLGRGANQHGCYFRCLGLLLVALVLIVSQFGCGSGGAKATSTPVNTPTVQPGTPAGNYTVTIIASSGSAQRTATITVTVQ